MKLCPECDFIYEDNQSFCDMDGKELVLRPAAEPRFRLTIPIKPADQTKTSPYSVPKARSANSLVLVAVVVILLTALVVAVYVARQRQNRARSAQPTQPSSQAIDKSRRPSAQPATDKPSESQSLSDQTSTDPANETSSVSSASPDESVQTASSKVSLAHSRLNSGPVSASAAAANGRGPVIVRLTNGAVIKADDAWEKKEGVWYRQAGMVTFLKRSSVRSIESTPAPRSQSTTTNVAGRSSSEGGADGDRNQTTKNTRSRDQLRIAKLEPVSPRKESRVTSFFKKTGKLIKKPFKF